MEEICKGSSISKFVLVLGTMTVCAGNIQDTKIVTGTKKLLEDFGAALIIIATAGAAVYASYAELMHRKAEDVGEQTKWKNIRNGAGIGLIVILSMGSLFSVFANYYK